jgi:sortase A
LLPTANWVDRTLLVVEIFGAIVVAWLAIQYVYTVYFDTAPRRVTPSTVIATPTERARSVAQPTATRVAEVAIPLVGPPDYSSPGQPATPTPIPTPTIDRQLLLPTRLRIPVMFLDSPVREVRINMGQWEVSPMDIGHHEGTGVPGQVGNVVLAGHRDINSALFRELDRLKPGDEVFVSNNLGEYRYIVKESFVVGPTHTEVMDPTDDKRVTLITCTPIGLDTQRLIVTAILEEPDTGTTDGGR